MEATGYSQSGEELLTPNVSVAVSEHVQLRPAGTRPTLGPRASAMTFLELFSLIASAATIFALIMGVFSVWNGA